MVRPTDQETTAIEKSLLLTGPKRRGPAVGVGTQGSTRSQEAEGVRGEHGRETVVVFTGRDR